jgi:hypothetical protein
MIHAPTLPLPRQSTTLQNTQPALNRLALVFDIAPLFNTLWRCSLYKHHLQLPALGGQIQK